ncbi:MAG: KH domain-containing protein [Candidatus Blackburnbacteria bacterium]|nr:KH domain-containing protein [Candidatus Blackburnbacteria bacterium]
MIELLEYITQAITGEKGIKVEKDTSGDFITYTIKAPKAVMGLLIGKEGRTIRAIRTLARARAIVDQEKISIQLEEEAE